MNHRQSFYQKFLAKKMRENHGVRSIRKNKNSNSITSPIVNFNGKSRTLKESSERENENNSKESDYFLKKNPGKVRVMEVVEVKEAVVMIFTVKEKKIFLRKN